MDSDKVVICKKCMEDFREVPYTNPFQFRGLYINYKVPEDNICPGCKSKLITTKVTREEMKIIYAISHDNDFLQAMIDLKDNDIIEYNLKLSQFRSQVEQLKNEREQKKKEEAKEKIQSFLSKLPKCPTCSSTNIRKITLGEQFQDMAWGGITAPRNYKTFICNNCGYEW